MVMGQGDSATQISYSPGSALLHEERSRQDLSVVHADVGPRDLGVGKMSNILIVCCMSIHIDNQPA